MSDEPQHDKAELPDEVVEDLAPDDAEQEVSGGAFDTFEKQDVFKTGP